MVISFVVEVLLYIWITLTSADHTNELNRDDSKMIFTIVYTRIKVELVSKLKMPTNGLLAVTRKHIPGNLSHVLTDYNVPNYVTISYKYEYEASW